MLVVVEEGDNEPLPIATARALLPAYRIRLFRAPDARLRVAYGRADLSRQLWGLLAFTLWYERHVERTPGDVRFPAVLAER